MTAEELADELEVSKRTIYRDINALSVAGVPVYANGGPGGGYALLDSYRTTLTGLNEDEIRALFMLTIPGCMNFRRASIWCRCRGYRRRCVWT